MSTEPAADPLLNAVQARLNRAIATHQSGRPADALKDYRAVIGVLICHKEVEDLYASALYALGQLGSAVKAFRLSATGSVDPKAALVELCGRLREAGHGAEALTVLRQMTALKPTAGELLDLAEVELALDRPDAAMTLTDRAKAAPNPTGVPEGRYRLVRGGALRRLDRAVEARDALAGIRDGTAFNLMLHFERATVFEALGDQAACRRAARHGLLIAPETVELFGRAGLALPDDGAEPDIGGWSTCVAPHSARLWTTRAARAFESGDISSTGLFAKRALLLAPEDGAGYGNLVAAVHMRERLSKALAICGWMTCLGTLPEAARFAASLVHLEAGDLALGWSLFEARHGMDDSSERVAAPPPWDGTRDLELVDGPLLLMTEQGLGDETLFLSCLPDLLEEVGANRLLVECDKRLLSLFERSFPEAAFLPRQTRDAVGGGTPLFDYRTVRERYRIVAALPNGSLPARYRSDATRAAPRGYLKAEQDAVRRWRAATTGDGPPDGMRIGLCWRSGVSSAVRDQTYATIDDMVPILEAGRELGAHFFSLQYDDIGAEAARALALAGVEIRVPEGLDQRNDLDGTAGFLASLDLVISVSTFQGAFAAALGVRVLKLWTGYFVPLPDRDLFFGGVTPMLHTSEEAGRDGLPLAIGRAAQWLRNSPAVE